MYKCSLTVFSPTNLSLEKDHGDGGVGTYRLNQLEGLHIYSWTTGVLTKYYHCWVLLWQGLIPVKTPEFERPYLGEHSSSRLTNADSERVRLRWTPVVDEDYAVATYMYSHVHHTSFHCKKIQSEPWVPILDEAIWVSLRAHALESISSFLTIRKFLDRMNSLALVRQPVTKNEKFWIQNNCSPLK